MKEHFNSHGTSFFVIYKIDDPQRLQDFTKEIEKHHAAEVIPGVVLIQTSLPAGSFSHELLKRVELKSGEDLVIITQLDLDGVVSQTRKFESLLKPIGII